MSRTKGEKKAIAKKLLHKYRLVILNEDTFEERVSFKLTRLNVFILVGISAIVLIALTTLLIAFTPLREYIPGYSSTKLKKQAFDLKRKTDSLATVIAINDQQYASIKKVLTGDLKTIEFNKDSIQDKEIEVADITIQPSKEDSLLRATVEAQDKYNLFETATRSADFALFPPVKGMITAGFDSDSKHYAVDVVTEKDEPVKAAADGTVIFASWTADTGHVIIIEHQNDLITAYKHNASLSKQQGDLVKAGEVIAIVGNTGELTTGPHLHFELWNNGYPINPINYIDFK
ncbi:M23 family metallopeptidase [Dokdonia ponticola]|uniref:M23 family metallopeptidase n=1 Tax=Dokdonia ponticola TaxID=2041041 RepID=A0ABV9HV50_9FLAO